MTASSDRSPVRRALRPSAMRSQPVRMDRVFDDPARALALVDELAPYGTVGVFYNGGLADPDALDPPWFLTEPPIDWLVHNPNWIAAAREAFAAEIVRPIRCVVNVNPPAGQGPPHLDLPVFRGFTTPEQPIWLLMAMARSGLFHDWLVPLASGVAWFWRGEGGGFEYWPAGPGSEPVRELAPMWNIGVMADNEAMWHRVTAIGPAALRQEFASGVPGTSRIHRDGSGWQIRDGVRTLASYRDDEVRISFVWKAYVFHDEEHLASFEDRAYDLDRTIVADLFTADLAARGLPVPASGDPTDPAWREMLEAAYTIPEF